MTGPHAANAWIAISTLVAAVFVAAQAWVARTAYVEASETRLLEAQLDACFDSFDAAAELDMQIRMISGDPKDPDAWPPRVVPLSRAQGIVVHNRILPAVERLEAQLQKSSVLGTLEDERRYLLQQVAGLGEALRGIAPDRVRAGTDDSQVTAAFDLLSDLIGAQHLVLLGCRTLTAKEV